MTSVRFYLYSRNFTWNVNEAKFIDLQNLQALFRSNARAPILSRKTQRGESRSARARARAGAKRSPMEVPTLISIDFLEQTARSTPEGKSRASTRLNDFPILEGPERTRERRKEGEVGNKRRNYTASRNATVQRRGPRRSVFSRRDDTTEAAPVRLAGRHRVSPRKSRSLAPVSATAEIISASTTHE